VRLAGERDTVTPVKTGAQDADLRLDSRVAKNRRREALA
jgi:hypothetical protein